MNKGELSDYYFYLSAEADKKGLAQKKDEYRTISTALWHDYMDETSGHVAFDLSRIMSWKPCYETVWYAWPRYFKDGYGNRWNWLTDKWNWHRHTSPGFPEFFFRIWKNIKIFIFWYLSPWFHMRYRFLDVFAIQNDCKLLDDDINWKFVRNRQSDQAYYLLEFHGFRYTLTKTQIIKDGEDGGKNSFMLGMIIGLSKMTDEEREAEKAKYHEVKTKVCSGWVFGWRSFMREMNKIVDITPDLDWEKVF